jgi:hypothetical protein
VKHLHQPAEQRVIARFFERTAERQVDQRALGPAHALEPSDERAEQLGALRAPDPQRSSAAHARLFVLERSQQRTRSFLARDVTQRAGSMLGQRRIARRVEQRQQRRQRPLRTGAAEQLHEPQALAARDATRRERTRQRLDRAAVGVLRRQQRLGGVHRSAAGLGVGHRQPLERRAQRARVTESSQDHQPNLRREATTIERRPHATGGHGVARGGQAEGAALGQNRVDRAVEAVAQRRRERRWAGGQRREHRFTLTAGLVVTQLLNERLASLGAADAAE